MITPYLTRPELRELTGTPNRARQRAWLAARGWRYETDVHGQIKVARAHHDRKMLGERTADPLPAVRPNLEAA